MPNLFLTSNNVFKGRSFDELLRPLAMYTDVYNQAEQAIGDLQAKAGIWENLANEQTDPIAYATYKKYADDLRAQSQILATSKLNPSTSRNILDLKRRYATDIVPIEQAYANRKAQADEQRKAMLQNPTLLLSRRADLTSLDDYVANPQLGYEAYSGALLAQQVGTAASALAKQLRGAIETGRLDDFTKTWTQRHGYTIDEVYQAINNPHDPKSNKVLTSIVDDAVNGSGIPQWGDRNILKQAYDYAGQGLWNALGETKIGTFDDKAAILAAEEAKEKRLIATREASQRRLMYERAALAAAQQGAGGLDAPQLIPRALRSGKDIQDAAAMEKAVKMYVDRKWLRKTDTGYEITEEGKKQYLKLHEERRKSQSNRRKLSPVTGATDFNKIKGIDENYHDFSQFIEEMYNKGAGHNDKNGPRWGTNKSGVFILSADKINSSLSKAIEMYDDDYYDLTRETGWIQQLDDSDSKYLRRLALGRGDPKDTMKKLTFNGQGWDEEKVKKSDFDGYIPIERENSIYGTRITWYNDKTMDSFKTNEPSGINPRMSETTHSLNLAGHKYQQILQAGKLPQYDDNGNFVTDSRGRIQFTDIPLDAATMAALSDEYAKIMFDADHSAHSVISPGKTKPRVYETHEPSIMFGGYGATGSGFSSIDDLEDLEDLLE